MAIQTLHRLSIATYNLHGLNQGSDLLASLCNDHDIVFVQEHWLPSFDLYRLHNSVSDNVCFASSAMDDVIAKDCLHGRPFGGVAIFVKSHLASTVKLIKAASRYIMIQVDQTVFGNVYLPCVSSTDREQDILDCLADIMNVLDTLNFVNIVFWWRLER